MARELYFDSWKSLKTSEVRIGLLGKRGGRAVTFTASRQGRSANAWNFGLDGLVSSGRVVETVFSTTGLSGSGWWWLYLGFVTCCHGSELWGH